ncbi:MAG: energy transducer TonB [Betaproteobacteria bacterium]|nr:energy transducer TonB [Betaproteobacteria bacterium]
MNPAAPRSSLAGAALLGSALVHAAAFVAFGAFDGFGTRTPTEARGPIVVQVALAPWPPVVTTPSVERAVEPVAGRSGAVRSRSGPDRDVLVPQEGVAPERIEGIAAPEPARAEGPAAAAAAPAVVAVVSGTAMTAAVASAVVVPAAYLATPEPAYPASAREEGEEGIVLLKVRVSRSGLPEEIVLERSSGFRELDRAAVAGVKRWTFTPARRGAEPIEAWMRIPVRFRLG